MQRYIEIKTTKFTILKYKVVCLQTSLDFGTLHYLSCFGLNLLCYVQHLIRLPEHRCL